MIIESYRSHYVLSGMYAKECALYHGPATPKMGLPGWMKPAEKQDKDI